MLSPTKVPAPPHVPPRAPTKKEDSSQTQQQQKQPPAQQKKKMGIAVALLLILVASSYDTLDILTTFIIGDDYGILDILYFPTTIGFWLYFWMKGINKRGLFLLAYLIEWLPVVDILNLQTVYALIIIWTNMTKTGEKMAKNIPAPKLNPLPKAA